VEEKSINRSFGGIKRLARSLRQNEGRKKKNLTIRLAWENREEIRDFPKKGRAGRERSATTIEQG